MEKQDVLQAKTGASVEHFETFDPNTQLSVLNKLKTTLIYVRAFEDEVPSHSVDELVRILEDRISELQIIYNMRTNRKLGDFFGK